MSTAKIEKDALHLPAPDRARLAQKLLISLEDLPEVELERLWLDEAERRAKEVDAGGVQMVLAKEVSRKARALLK